MFLVFSITYELLMIFHDLLLWVSLHCIITAYLNIIYIQGLHFVTEAVTLSKYIIIIKLN